MPGAWLSQNALLKGRSVPSFCVTAYCSGVRQLLSSVSLGFFHELSGMTKVLFVSGLGESASAREAPEEAQAAITCASSVSVASAEFGRGRMAVSPSEARTRGVIRHSGARVSMLDVCAPDATESRGLRAGSGAAC